MIKAENGLYYMTAGPVCYIIKEKNDELARLFFGARVEAEDDLAALGMESFAVAESPVISATVDGKTFVAELKVIGAEILAEKPKGGAVHVGGKTLKITMSADKPKLSVTAMYTPYSRGGVLRSFVIENRGERRVALDWSLVMHACADGCAVITADGKTVAEKYCEKNPSSFAAVVCGCTETHGDAYGFLNVHGDDGICLRKLGSGAALCCEKRAIVLNNGETYRSPDLLCVYSDAGIGGMSRIFHDILRDNRVTGMRSERAPVALFVDKPDFDRIEDCVREAGELGIEVFAVDGDELTRAELKKLSDACKAAGMKAGVKVAGRIAKQSALFGEYCNKDRIADISDGQGIDAFIKKLSELVRTFDIEYVMIQSSLFGMRAASRALDALNAEFAELCTELDVGGQERGYDRTLYAPLGATRNIVKITGADTLKSRFDKATLGRLGYAFDPLEADSGVKRAVRAQILSYQDDAGLISGGDLYRTRTAAGEKCMTAVSKDKSKAYAVCERYGNAPASVKLHGLDERNIYFVRELGKSFSGAALCACGVPLPPSNEPTTVTLHIRQVADYE